MPVSAVVVVISATVPVDAELPMATRLSMATAEDWLEKCAEVFSLEPNIAGQRRGEAGPHQSPWAAARQLNRSCSSAVRLLPTGKSRTALGHRLVHSCSTRCTCCMHAEPSPTAAATRFTLPQRTSPTANIPGMLDSKNCGWRAFGHLAAGRSAPCKSAPVRTNPLSLRAIQELSQPVHGSAPVMRKTWPMSWV